MRCGMGTALHSGRRCRGPLDVAQCSVGLAVIGRGRRERISGAREIDSGASVVTGDDEAAIRRAVSVHHAASLWTAEAVMSESRAETTKEPGESQELEGRLRQKT